MPSKKWTALLQAALLLCSLQINTHMFVSEIIDTIEGEGIDMKSGYQQQREILFIFHFQVTLPSVHDLLLCQLSALQVWHSDETPTCSLLRIMNTQQSSPLTNLWESAIKISHCCGVEKRTVIFITVALPAYLEKQVVTKTEHQLTFCWSHFSFSSD